MTTPFRLVAAAALLLLPVMARAQQQGACAATSDPRQLFGQYDAMRQTASVPFTLNIVASIIGFSGSTSPASFFE